MKTFVEEDPQINSDVRIVLPTYSEAANIEKLIEKTESLEASKRPA